MFNIGDKIKLKDYHHYSDYKKHEDEIATIVHRSLLNREILDEGWNVTLEWDDGNISVAKKCNILNIEWDNETN